MRPAADDNYNGPFVGSRWSQVYHHPWCRDAKKIKPENLVEYPTAPEGKRMSAVAVDALTASSPRSKHREPEGGVFPPWYLCCLRHRDEGAGAKAEWSPTSLI